MSYAVLARLLVRQYSVGGQRAFRRPIYARAGLGAPHRWQCATRIKWRSHARLSRHRAAECMHSAGSAAACSFAANQAALCRSFKRLGQRYAHLHARADSAWDTRTGRKLGFKRIDQLPVVLINCFVALVTLLLSILNT